jgi:hypothetical protein
VFEFCPDVSENTVCSISVGGVVPVCTACEDGKGQGFRNPKERIQHSENGEILKSEVILYYSQFYHPFYR